jgi:hypothetical protein
MCRSILLVLLLVLSARVGQAQALNGGGVLYAEVGLVAEVSGAPPAAACNPCGTLFPATRAGFVSPRWEVGAALIGPSLGEDYLVAGSPTMARPTLLALDARHRTGLTSLGARVLHTFAVDTLLGGLTSGIVLAGFHPTSSLAFEVGVGPLSIESAGIHETGWSALAGLRYAGDIWSGWAEVQGTAIQNSHGWAALAQISYRALLPTISLTMFAHGHSPRAEGPLSPGGPPFYSTPTAAETGQLGMVQATLGAEWPLHRGLKLLTEAGARTDADAAIRAVARAGIRLTLGPWSARVHPPSRWVVDGNRAELAVAHDDGGYLFLVGDFNGWAEPGVPLHPEGHVYRVALELPPGNYAYKIAVEDERGRRWLSLPADLATESDSFGGRNGLLIITG